jgi:hypothetical protein
LENGRIFKGFPLRCYTGTNPLPDVFEWLKEDIEDVELALSERSFVCLRHVKDPNDNSGTTDRSTPFISGDKENAHPMVDQGLWFLSAIAPCT